MWHNSLPGADSHGSKKHAAPPELTVRPRYVFSTNISPLTGWAELFGFTRRQLAPQGRNVGSTAVHKNETSSVGAK